MRGVSPNHAGKIIPGLYARVQVPVEGKVALLVPPAAVGEDQQGLFVMIVNEKNIVERRSIKSGPLVDNMRVIEKVWPEMREFYNRSAQGRPWKASQSGDGQVISKFFIDGLFSPTL